MYANFFDFPENFAKFPNFTLISSFAWQPYVKKLRKEKKIIEY